MQGEYVALGLLALYLGVRRLVSPRRFARRATRRYSRLRERLPVPYSLPGMRMWSSERWALRFTVWAGVLFFVAGVILLARGFT